MLCRSFMAGLFVAGCIGVAAAGEQRATLELEGRWWMPNLSAEGKVEQDDIGTEIDFKNDLGLADKDFPFGRLTWYIGPNSRLRASYTPISYSGDTAITKQIIFDGTTYTAGSRVITDLSVQYITFGWVWQPINIANGTFKLGPQIDLKGFLIDASLRAPALGVDESANVPAGFPTLGLVADLNPTERMNVFADISGISAGSYGYFFDAEAGLKLIPVKNLSIVGGYKILRLNAEMDPDFFKMQIAGPFAGLTLRF